MSKKTPQAFEVVEMDDTPPPWAGRLSSWTRCRAVCLNWPPCIALPSMDAWT